VLILVAVEWFAGVFKQILSIFWFLLLCFSLFLSREIKLLRPYAVK
jgi:hypothetical protein